MRVLPALLAAVLVLPLALAQPPATLSATVAPGALTLHVATAEEPVRATVVVVREDALLGPVLERALPVEVAPGAELDVVLDGLRVGANLTVKLVPADLPLPLAEDLFAVVDADALLELGDLGNVSTPPLPPASGVQTHRVRATPIPLGNESACTCFLAAAREGAIAVGWVGGGGPGRAPHLATVAISQDGGRSFDEPRVLNTNATTWVSNFAAAPLGGSLHFLFDQGMPTSASSADWASTRHVAIDARTGASLSARDHPPGHPAVNLWGLAPRADGAILFAQSTPAPQPNWGVRVHALHPNGTMGVVADIDLGPDATTPFSPSLVTNDLGQMALTYIQRDGGPAGLHRSSDGGRTWTAEDLGELDRRGATRAFQDSFLDETGMLHMLVLARESDEEATLVYVRAPPAGPVHVRDVTGPDGLVEGGDDADAARVVAHAGRVWLTWNPITALDDGRRDFGTVRAVESVDGGLTFSPPYDVVGEGGERILGHDVALLPDGRPAILGWHATRFALMPLFDPLLDTRVLVEAQPPVDLGAPPPRENEREPEEQQPGATPSRPTPTPTGGTTVPIGGNGTTSVLPVEEPERPVPAATPLLALAILALFRRRAPPT